MRNNISILLVTSAFISLSVVLNSCHKRNNSIQLSTDSKFMFPEDWIGEWVGEIAIWNQGKLTMQLPMKVRNLPTVYSDTLEWSLIYGEDEEKGLREYYLILDSLDNNHYVLDERNSIFLDGYIHGNCYISNFSVMGSQITSIYRLMNKDKMMFEIFFNTLEPGRTSGNSVIGTDTIPEVNSFPVLTYQRAYLTKIRE